MKRKYKPEELDYKASKIIRSYKLQETEIAR